jgi:hypothetical protein
MSAGHWVEIDARWFEQRMKYCALCGRIIPKRIWRADERVEEFCGPECADLDLKYGAKTAAPRGQAQPPHRDDEPR